MKVSFLGVALLLIIVTGAACTVKQSTTTSGQIIKKVTVAEANVIIQANVGNVAFVVLDVRTPDEFSGGHLAGAFLIDYDSGNFKNEVSKLDKNKTYLVYCRTSNRSGLAVAAMKDIGFREVYDLDGGILAWQAAGNPVVK